MALAHLQRYSKPENFADFGEVNRAEYFVAYGRHRDSNTLVESNWRVMLERLGGESDTVIILRDSHWAVGWVEAIYIHESDITRQQLAEEMLTDLDDYSILDESDLSELECDRAYTYWRQMRVRERVEWCQRYRVSVFAARRDDIPEDPSGELLSALAE
jgi:hypothetical protein